MIPVVQSMDVASVETGCNGRAAIVTQMALGEGTMLKSFVLAVTGAVGLWFISGIGSGAYSRSVPRPQSEVMAALASLDVPDRSHRSALHPCLPGDKELCVRLERHSDHMTWKVTRGSIPVATMTANFTPTLDGKATRISTSVQQGRSPSDASGAYGSHDDTMRSFASALDARLSKLALSSSAPEGSVA